jgi:hypothetical protein
VPGEEKKGKGLNHRGTEDTEQSRRNRRKDQSGVMDTKALGDYRGSPING